MAASLPLDVSRIVFPHFDTAHHASAVGHTVKPKIFGPLTLLGFSVVDSFFRQSIAVRIAPGSCQPMIHVA